MSLFWTLTSLDRDMARKGSLHSSSPPSAVWVLSDCFWVGGRELEKPLLLKVEGGGMASRSLTPPQPFRSEIHQKKYEVPHNKSKKQMIFKSQTVFCQTAFSIRVVESRPRDCWRKEGGRDLVLHLIPPPLLLLLLLLSVLD